MEAIYQRDSDQDGLTDAQELALGTNPLIWEQVDQVIRVTDLSHR